MIFGILLALIGAMVAVTIVRSFGSSRRERRFGHGTADHLDSSWTFMPWGSSGGSDSDCGDAGSSDAGCDGGSGGDGGGGGGD